MEPRRGITFRGQPDAVAGAAAPPLAAGVDVDEVGVRVPSHGLGGLKGGEAEGEGWMPGPTTVRWCRRVVVPRRKAAEGTTGVSLWGIPFCGYPFRLRDELRRGKLK